MSELQPVQELNPSPFKNMVVGIGLIPTAYKESLTYFGALTEIVKYINEQLIPAVNGDGAAITELQEKYILLKDYVDHYFDNLDVQEEINNKLDDMAEHGELADIIAQYLQLAGVLAFDTIADMQAATNIVNGSTAKTLGAANYLDGKGRYYKIRNITNDDTIDGVNIISITADPTNTLIAELIPDETISKVETIEDTVSHLADKKYIFIGDSWNTTDTPTGGVPIVPWSLKVRDYMGLTDGVDCFRSGVSGAGWVHNTDHTFLKQLQALSISDKESITDIVVLGGINDMTESDSDVWSAVQAFSNYCKTNYPNATITTGFLQNEKAESGKEYLRHMIAYYNSSFNVFSNVRIIGDAFTWSHNYGNHQPVGHLKQSGSEEIAQQLKNYLLGGVAKECWSASNTITGWDHSSNIISDRDTIFNMLNGIDGNTVNVKLKMAKSNLSCTGSTITSLMPYKIGEIAGNNQFFWFEDSTDTEKGVLQSGIAYIYNGSTFTQMPYVLYAYQKDIYIKFNAVATSSQISVTNPTQITLLPNSQYTNLDALYC